jgi:hypothetical protein
VSDTSLPQIIRKSFAARAMACADSKGAVSTKARKSLEAA